MRGKNRIDPKRRPPLGGFGWLALFLALALAAKGLAAEARNVRLLGHCDLQGRPALQVVLKGDFAYVGHHSGTAINPLSGEKEPNGTSIVDVSDPSQPKLVHHIPGYAGAESRAVQVVEKFYEGAETRDGKIIGGTLVYIAYFNAGLRVVDIADPFHPREVGFYVPETPANRGVVQTNDVDLDYRGYVYITDRAGAGLHILEYGGNN